MKSVGHRRHSSVLARRVRAALAIVALCYGSSLALFSDSIQAQTRLPDAASVDAHLVGKLSRRGDLSLRNATLSEALFTISETWKINLVVGEEVQGKVSGVFADAPLHEILDAILLANGYSYRPVGQGLVIMKSENLGEVNHPLFETVTITLRHGDPETVLPALKLLGSPQGKVQAIPAARSIMVADFPEHVATIRRMIREIDVAVGRVEGGLVAGDAAVQVASFTPQFVPAKSLRDSLQTVLTKDGKVSIVEDENQIVVVDTPVGLKLAKDVIERLDVPRPQVRIRAMIYDVSLEDMEALGVNWKHALKGQTVNGVPQNLWGIDSLTRVPLATGVPDSLMTFASLSRNFDISVVISALESAQDARLLADPTVVVRNNAQAMIQIVEEIPFQQLTQTAAGGEIGTTGFREAGVKLEVTPRISNDSTILLDVTPSFSRLTGFQDGQPVIAKRETQTSVRVVDGQTLVIGGLRSRSDIGDFNGVPYLKNLRFGLGKLFRGKETTVRESELIVFITTEIITPENRGTTRQGQAYGVSNDLLDRIPLARLPSVKGPVRRFHPRRRSVVNEPPHEVVESLSVQEPKTSTKSRVKPIKTVRKPAKSTTTVSKRVKKTPKSPPPATVTAKAKTKSAPKKKSRKTVRVVPVSRIGRLPAPPALWRLPEKTARNMTPQIRSTPAPLPVKRPPATASLRPQSVVRRPMAPIGPRVQWVDSGAGQRTVTDSRSSRNPYDAIRVDGHSSGSNNAARTAGRPVSRLPATRPTWR